MSKKKFMEFLKEKGYYIALGLCAVAIGISGYLYYQNNQEDPMKSPSNQQVSIQGGDVQTGVTTPESDPTTSPTEPSAPTKKPGKITQPVSGSAVLGYAVETLCYNPTTRDWRTHNGIDYAAEAGTEVCAAADGIVYTVYEDETMGTTVVIRHDGGYTTKYASLGKEVSVTAGQEISAGDVIGTVGCTALLETAIGDHLHFSVTLNGEAVDPEDFLD